MLVLCSSPGPDVYFYPRPHYVPGAEGDWQVPTPAPLSAISAPPAMDVGFHAANQVLASDLIAPIEEKREPVSSGRDGEAAVEMILAVYASHVAGIRVALPLKERGHPLEEWRPAP